MSLLQQNPWWLVPFVVLMLVMVHAMMEFTLSLLVQHPRDKRKPLAAGELRRRLLALNGPSTPYPIVDGIDCDLEISWRTEDTTPAGHFIIAKGASASRIRLLLDEGRHELRLNQVSHSFGLYLGRMGWRPRVGGHLSWQAGPPAQAPTKDIIQVASRNGWVVRPVVLWFQATHRGLSVLEKLTPVPLRRWSARRFWGILYPLSYALGLGYLAIIAGLWDMHTVLIFVGVSAAWWCVWGLLAWLVCGCPHFWRSRRR